MKKGTLNMIDPFKKKKQGQRGIEDINPPIGDSLIPNSDLKGLSRILKRESDDRDIFLPDKEDHLNFSKREFKSKMKEKMKCLHKIDDSDII